LSGISNYEKTTHLAKANTCGRTHSGDTRFAMSTPTITKILTVFTAALLVSGAFVKAEERVVTTTTAGTISEFSPDTIVVRSETSPDPIRYSYSKTTTYVDDAGNPVSVETVKSGLPVTVHYIHEGERLVADRVIVHRRATEVAPAAVEEKHTTTTTTTSTDRPLTHEERKAAKEERKAEKHEEKAQRELDKADSK